MIGWFGSGNRAGGTMGSGNGPAFNSGFFGSGNGPAFGGARRGVFIGGGARAGLMHGSGNRANGGMAGSGG